MTIRDAISLANSEVVFAVLFIVGLFAVARYVNNVIREQKEENKYREEQLFMLYQKQIEDSARREADLMRNLERNTEQLTNVANTLKEIQRNLSKLEEKVDTNFMQVWKELGAKVDRDEINKNTKFFDSQ